MRTVERKIAMKAAYIEKPGGPEVFVYGDLPDLVPGPGQVRVRVRAISLNHVETIMRSGVRPYFKITPPHVLGNEYAGEVIDVGPGVSEFSPGDRVTAITRTGSYAEMAISEAGAVFPLPAGTSFEEGAALASTGVTAYRMVVRRAAVRAGERVLVTAAASGTGLFIMQIAKAAGCTVFATAGSDEKRKLLEDHGADATIDHYRDDVAARLDDLTGGRGIDAAIDAVSSQMLFDAITQSLRPGGRLVTYGNIASSEVTLNVRTLFSKGLEIRGGQGSDPLFAPAERASDGMALMALVASGKLRTVIDRTLPLAEASTAHELLEAHQVAGKIILIP